MLRVVFKGFIRIKPEIPFSSTPQVQMGYRRSRGQRQKEGLWRTDPSALFSNQSGNIKPLRLPVLTRFDEAASYNFGVDQLNILSFPLVKLICNWLKYGAIHFHL